MWCVSYLEKVIPRFQKVVQDAIKNETIPDKRIRALYLECKKRKMQIESAIENENMTIDQYVEKL